MRKKILTVLLIGIMIFTLASCDIAVLGKWTIAHVTAGDVQMSRDDIIEMGLDVGYVKLNKSGNCKINLLGDEYDGTWHASGKGASVDNQIEITYGSNMNGIAVFDEKGQMVFTDSQGAEYILEK